MRLEKSPPPIMARPLSSSSTEPEMLREFISLSLIYLFKIVKEGGALYVSDFPV